MIKDHVKCNNCGWGGLVEVGAETCPDCGAEGTLAWKDENKKEVEA